MAKNDGYHLSVDSQRRLEYDRLLGLVSSYAYSRPGKEAVQRLVPECSPSAIRQELQLVEELRVLLRSRFAFRLSGLIDLPALFGEEEEQSRTLTPEELDGIGQLLERNQSLGESLGKRPDLPRLHALVKDLGGLPVLREHLERSIGSKGEILCSASPELASLRREAEEREAQIRSWLEKRRGTASLRKALQGDVITIRNDRFVFAVRTDQRHLVRGILHGESTSGATVFIEPEGIVLWGNKLYTLRQGERREEARILAELTAQVWKKRVGLLAVWQRILTLDVGLARARFAEVFGCSSPEIVEERTLKIDAARHPLLMWRERHSESGMHDLGLDEVQRRVIPLNLELGASSYQMVITGPNTGGKTVVLKTVGLLTLMANSGIPIPAEAGCRIPVFDQVLADIGDEQSLEQNLSTFSSHMTVIARLLQRASSRSLILIDELGAGTDPLEGAALAEAILDQLYERGAFTLVTTHLGRLKEFAFRRRKCQNASMEFDPVRLAPTYRLVSGLPGRSNALIIAKRIGIPEEVLARCEQLLSTEDRLDPTVLAGMERTRRDLERRSQEMEKERQNASQLRQDAAQQVRELTILRTAIEHEAERAEEQRVQKMVQEAEAALKELGDLPAERRRPYQRLRDALVAALHGTTLAERRRQRARSLSKGDFVFVPRFQAVCEVRKINKTKELMTVSLNGVPTEISFLDISWIMPPPGFELEWYQE
ncbi:MAG: hypothetical protein V3T77_02280 [Planctomycetota bacterium]